jgi:hypothetical protein
MSGAIPPLPNTPSWRDAQLKEATSNFETSTHLKSNENSFFKPPSCLMKSILFVCFIAGATSFISGTRA